MPEDWDLVPDSPQRSINRLTTFILFCLKTLTAVPTFNYKTFCKTARNFITIVLPMLASKREIAIARAKVLEAAFNDNHKSHECNPCTKVHHLVESIIFYGARPLQTSCKEQSANISKTHS